MYPRAADPDDSLDDHRPREGADGRGGQRGGFVGLARQKLGDGCLQDLEKRDDHDDGEDENPQRLEPAAAHRELVVQPVDLPANQLVGHEDDERAQQIQRRVDQASDQGQR